MENIKMTSPYSLASAAKAIAQNKEFPENNSKTLSSNLLCMESPYPTEIHDLHISTDLLNAKYLHCVSHLEEELIHEDIFVLCENCIDSMEFKMNETETEDKKSKNKCPNCHYIYISKWECRLCTILKKKKKELNNKINNLLFEIKNNIGNEDENENQINTNINTYNLSKMCRLQKHYNRFILFCLESRQ